MNPQTSKSVKSLWSLLHRNYTFDCFFRILSNIKMKLAHILLQLVTNISNSFTFNALPLMQSSKLDPGPFAI